MYPQDQLYDQGYADGRRHGLKYVAFQLDTTWHPARQQGYRDGYRTGRRTTEDRLYSARAQLELGISLPSTGTK